MAGKWAVDWVFIPTRLAGDIAADVARSDAAAICRGPVGATSVGRCHRRRRANPLQPRGGVGCSRRGGCVAAPGAEGPYGIGRAGTRRLGG